MTHPFPGPDPRDLSARSTPRPGAREERGVPRFVTQAAAPGAPARAAHPLLVWPAVACGLLSLAMIGAELGWRGLALGALVAVVPVPGYVMLALWLDRFEAEPPQVLAQTFAWGATVAVFLALVVNTYAESAVAGVLGPEAAAWFGAVVSAPMVEEVAKGLALLFLYHELVDEFDGVVDGVVYASMVGLGFAMVENVQYYGEALHAGEHGPLQAFVVRGMMSPFAHPLFTSMIGIGLGLARERGHGASRGLLPLAGLVVAVTLHSLWNAASGSPGWFLWAYVVVMVPVFLGVISLILVSLRREGAVIREHLRPLVEEDLLSPEELDCLCTVRARMRASLRAWWHGGRVRWRDRREMHQVASELAFHRWRVGRGLSRGELLDAARDADYVRRLRELGSRISHE